MSSTSDIARRFFESQDRLRGGPDPALCAPGYVSRIGSMPPMTLADHQQFSTAFYRGFPDLRHTIDETIAGDGKTVIRFTLRGTHKDAFMGIPATGKEVQVGAIAIFTVAEDKVSELHGQFDQLGMMRQLGVVP
jgi:steroid delta-isomerase-like uncharacterized protein